LRHDRFAADPAIAARYKLTADSFYGSTRSSPAIPSWVQTRFRFTKRLPSNENRRFGALVKNKTPSFEV